MWLAGRVVPGLSVGVPEEHPAVFVVAWKPGTPAATLVGGNFIEAEDTDENHAHNRSREKKSLPTGLKGNTLHALLPALKTADVRCMLAGISAQRLGCSADFDSKVMPRNGEGEKGLLGLCGSQILEIRAVAAGGRESGPIGAIERPVLDGFSEVGDGEGRRAFQVGNGAGDFEDAIVGAGGEALLLHGALEETLRVGA